MEIDIKQLIPLQEVDIEIFDIKKQLAGLPDRKAKIESELKALEQDLANKQSNYENLVKKGKDIELAIAEKEETANKLKVQLNVVKTNQEYSQIMQKIKEIEDEISNLETNELVLLEEIDKEKANVKVYKGEFEAGKAEIDKKLNELKEIEKELNAQLSQLEEKRAAIALNIEKDALQLYEKIIENRKGLALCKVDKNGICSGCFLSLSPQVVNELMLGKKMVQCPSCSRILYYDGGSD